MRPMISEYDAKPKLKEIGYVSSIAKIYIHPEQLDEQEYAFHSLLERGGDELASAEIDPKEDIAVFQYTGGTTGRSKAAMLTHYNIVANVYQMFSTYGGMFKRPGERMLSISPFFHVYGMNNCMNTSVFSAATIICMRRFQVGEAIELIKKHRPTFFPGVPTMYTALLHHPQANDAGLESIKVCNSGSAPMPAELLKEFESKTGATNRRGLWVF